MNKLFILLISLSIATINTTLGQVQIDGRLTGSFPNFAIELALSGNGSFSGPEAEDLIFVVKINNPSPDFNVNVTADPFGLGFKAQAFSSDQFLFNNDAAFTLSSLSNNSFLKILEFEVTAGTGNSAGLEFGRIAVNGVDNFGSILSSDIVLPVELTEFTVEAYEHKAALLTWITATELNNDHFRAEHSTDGRAFTEVGVVPGHGTTTDAQHYSFIHTTPAAGHNYYRLRQVDVDGSFEYSSIEHVYIDHPTVRINIYPNPTTSILNIRFPADAPDMPLQLFDQTGRLILEEKIGADTPQPTLTLGHLPKGIYWLRLGKAGQVRTQRIVLQ